MGFVLWAVASVAAAQPTGGSDISTPTAQKRANTGPAKAAGPGTQPPTPSKADAPPTLLYYAVFAGLAGATVAISIMPSKRGHRD